MTSASLRIKQIDHELTWPVRHRVMWPDHPLDFVKVPDDATGTHFGLFVGSELVTVVSLFKKNNIIQFRKLATEIDYQGRGYGKAMMQHIIDWSKTHQCHKIWCNARIDKTHFYEKFGMAESDATYEKGSISFIIMEMML